MSEQYVYGIHPVTALLKNPVRSIHQLIISSSRQDDKLKIILDLAKEKNIAVMEVDPQRLNQDYAKLTHQGVVAKVGALPEYHENDLPSLLQKCTQPYLILILDGITDPHNLGACLRTADAAGVNFVIIPKDKNASITPVVSKVACGAAESIPMIKVTNLVRTIEKLKEQGVWIYGAAGEATQSLYDMDCTGSMAVVMGAEGSGLRRLTRENCDNLFSLPMAGSVESLNVSVATGVTLYEIRRQRTKDL